MDKQNTKGKANGLLEAPGPSKGVGPQVQSLEQEHLYKILVIGDFGVG